MSAATRLVSRGIFLFLAGAALALVFASSAAAAEPSFSARGSVEQVYATGLPAGAQASLLNPAGQVVATRNANDLGGLLFRNVTPGDGYRVRLTATSETSGPLTVLTTQSAPPSTDVYNQTVPSDGYGYLTTRDGTKLAYSVHPPTDITNVEGVDLPHNPAGDNVPSPTLIEYSGYGYAKPAGPQSGIAALANLMGFTVVDVNMRGTGLLGRRVRLLRAAAEPRRLRRHRDGRPPAVGRPPQGRHARHLLRRHQPAVHRPDAASEPRRDHARSR